MNLGVKNIEFILFQSKKYNELRSYVVRFVVNICRYKVE